MTGWHRAQPTLWLWAVFAFFYLPLPYSDGWGLPPGTGLDFPSYYHAARFAFVHQISPYGMHVFDYLPGTAGDHVQPYIYPPPSLLVFWPLIHLPLEQAREAFRAFNHVCYLGSIVLLLRWAVPGARRQQWVAALCLIYILNFDAAFSTIFLGQINLLILVLLCLALLALQNHAAPWRVALPLSVAILIKTYPALLIPVLLFRRQFRAALLTGVFFAALAALSYAVLPRGVWSTWVNAALPAAGYGNDLIHAGFLFNQSLNAFVMRLLSETHFSQAPLFHPSLARPVTILLAGLVASLTLYSSFRLRRGAAGLPRGKEEAAAYLLMAYLVAPISWDHHLVYILPATLLAIRLLTAGEVTGRTSIAVAACLFLIAWRLPIDLPLLTRGWWTLLISAKLYPVLGLWVFFLARMRTVALPAA